MKRIRFLTKLSGIYILRFLMRVLRFIPIKKNRVVFTAYQAWQYSCNPRYISEYMEQQYPGKFEIIWIFHHPEEYDFLTARGIKVIQNKFFKKLYYELTASVSVVNASTRYSWMPPRKNQLHINTWHGGGYYKLSALSESRRDRFLKRRFAMASQNTSYYLSTNQLFTDNEIRHDFAYGGDVLNIGFPRNDIFFHCDYAKTHKKVCHYFGLKEDCRILMYAPTFRYEDAAQFVMPDFQKLKERAAQYFGGDWVVLTRMHYYMGDGPDSEGLYDANYRPDMPEMQELLAACDMLLSDYSSCIWDYSFTYRPCFLFTPDLEEYTADRGFGIDIYDWGFPVCKTEQELWDAMEHYDPAAFRKAMERHHDNLGSFERGNATEIMGKLIYDNCFPEQVEDI